MTEQSKFQIGDVVCLKSGSPTMTVTETNAGTVWCGYFDGNSQYQEFSIPEECLSKFVSSLRI